MGVIGIAVIIAAYFVIHKIIDETDKSEDPVKKADGDAGKGGGDGGGGGDGSGGSGGDTNPADACPSPNRKCGDTCCSNKSDQCVTVENGTSFCCPSSRYVAENFCCAENQSVTTTIDGKQSCICVGNKNITCGTQCCASDQSCVSNICCDANKIVILLNGESICCTGNELANVTTKKCEQVCGGLTCSDQEACATIEHIDSEMADKITKNVTHVYNKVARKLFYCHANDDDVVRTPLSDFTLPRTIRKPDSSGDFQPMWSTPNGTTFKDGKFTNDPYNLWSDINKLTGNNPDLSSIARNVANVIHEPENGKWKTPGVDGFYIQSFQLSSKGGHTISPLECAREMKYDGVQDIDYDAASGWCKAFISTGRNDDNPKAFNDKYKVVDANDTTSQGGHVLFEDGTIGQYTPLYKLALSDNNNSQICNLCNDRLGKFCMCNNIILDSQQRLGVGDVAYNGCKLTGQEMSAFTLEECSRKSIDTSKFGEMNYNEKSSQKLNGLPYLNCDGNDIWCVSGRCVQRKSCGPVRDDCNFDKDCEDHMECTGNIFTTGNCRKLP